MSVPGNINPAPPPSSFDDDPEFYEENRLKTLKRRVMEEPVLPLGCLLTCWALYEATKSMKAGDHHRTNRMFRRRIYAQGFTILAMVAGSIYWESDRKRRKEYQGLVDEKRKRERYEAWIKELEAREEEEQELRDVKRKIHIAEAAERERLTQGQKKGAEAKVKEELGQPKGGVGAVRSVLEESERRMPILEAAMEAWRRR